MQVTQATLSRDLVELDAVKVRSASGALVYAVPAEGGDRRPAAPGETAAAGHRLGRLLRRAAGHAPTPAPTWSCCAPRRAPPSSSPPRSTRPSYPDVLGTIAGDDTVLVIGRDPAGGDDLARRLLALAQQPAP